VLLSSSSETLCFTICPHALCLLYISFKMFQRAFLSLVSMLSSRRGNGLWKIQIQLDFFLLDFVGLDYFGCGCPHAKLNWMSKHELLILLSGSGRGSRI
jgi:hypothetical protein